MFFAGLVLKSGGFRKMTHTLSMECSVKSLNYYRNRFDRNLSK
jgi:hypothetical protein